MPLVLYRPLGGVGDALFLSGIARALALRGDRPWVSTRFAELFRHNPDVRGHLPVPVVKVWKRVEPARVRWLAYEPLNGPGRGHVLDDLATIAGLPRGGDYVPRVYLTEEERAWGRVRATGAFLIQTDAATSYTVNKSWFHDRFVAVADVLRREGRVLQIGVGNSPLLPGAEDWRGRTSLREVAALMAASRFFVGLEGALMHLARATDTPAVVVFGGYVSPAQTGYPGHKALFTPVPCAPCWRLDPCPYDRACMEAIRAEHVLTAVREAEREGKSGVSGRL